ncbi:DUF4376 domain-containing protein [Sphingobium sp. TB-6]|uniref:DUF4376 domain-containing protein n=1 Tax=Sphingobium sp. TB-6 TaxID=2728850 RepID=UPI00146A816D|nr:DUF4376 domain-containing protein [Sphingobium sp. TB-6]NML88342.1 DUF4376 domain-containing protein [Sphingobium sp. TB-6]
MEYFIIYKPATGEELMRGSGPDGIARLQQLAPDRGVVIISAEDAANVTPLDQIAPGLLRDSLWEWTKIIRSQMLVRGALTDWGVVDSDANAILNLHMKAGAAMWLNHEGIAGPMHFTMRDNSVVELTPTEVLKLSGQAMAYLDGIHEFARGLRASLDAANTALGVLAVDVFRGWPAI